jgi:hypothetical protein
MGTGNNEYPRADSSDQRAHSIEDWQRATGILERMLQSHNGCVSSRALRKELERRGIGDARQFVITMKFFDFDAEPDPRTPRPAFRFHHRGRSFYSQEAYRAAEAKTEAAADDASGAEAVIGEEEEEVAVTPPRAYRQEEARLVTYVKEALEALYGSDFGTEAEIAFDVHNQRPGSEFENVDVIAIHWRSDEVVDVVTVEVKLEFTSKLVQQANNYRRFSNRVWIALPVATNLAEAAPELREKDPLLFEYVVDSGIGVLACRRGRGRAYEVVPIQWPRLMRPDPIERDAFVQRYRSVFEDAGVVAPPRGPSYPRLR